MHTLLYGRVRNRTGSFLLGSSGIMNSVCRLKGPDNVWGNFMKLVKGHKNGIVHPSVRPSSSVGFVQMWCEFSMSFCENISYNKIYIIMKPPGRITSKQVHLLPLPRYNNKLRNFSRWNINYFKSQLSLSIFTRNSWDITLCRNLYSCYYGI